MVKLLVIFCFLLFTRISSAANWYLVYMDQAQTDHLRAYGLAYYALENSFKVEWLLNFRGGSFLMPDSDLLRLQAALFGVSGTVIGDVDKTGIMSVIADSNMHVVTLEKAPKVAVYTTPNSDPWDDAVTMVLDYAKIPYKKLWNDEVLRGELFEYDWLHLHHEDFTGQFGKFYQSFHNAPWYIRKVNLYSEHARRAGYDRVADWLGDVAKLIQEYVAKGGFLFAMCAATDSLDVALAAKGLDIIDPRIDGSPVDPGFQERLDFTQCFAFENFTVITDANAYEFSDIDVSRYENRYSQHLENFELFEFSAKFDTIPSILNQNHETVIKGFLGQTTAFNPGTVKSSVIRLGRMVDQELYKYIHGRFGKGMFTFYGGHDPEDFAHLVGDPQTDLRLHRNSPGYRLILNNLLFPAARPKPRKT